MVMTFSHQPRSMGLSPGLSSPLEATLENTRTTEQTHILAIPAQMQVLNLTTPSFKKGMGGDAIPVLFSRSSLECDIPYATTWYRDSSFSPDNFSNQCTPFQDALPYCSFNTVPHFSLPLEIEFEPVFCDFGHKPPIQHPPRRIHFDMGHKPPHSPPPLPDLHRSSDKVPQMNFAALNDAQGMFDAAKLTLESVTNFVNTVKQTVSYDGSQPSEFTDNIISRVEDLLLVMVTISSMDSVPKMIAPIIAYLKTCVKGSIFRKLHKMIVKIMSEDAEPPEKVGQAGWFETNFTALTKGSVGVKISQAINLMIMAGFMPDHMESFIGQEFYKMFTVQATAKRMKTTSIFEYVFTTVDWFLGSVIPACQSGDLSLLFSENDMFTIDKMYRDSLNTVDLWTSGQNVKVKEKYNISDEASILVMLEDCAAAHHSILKHTTDDAMRRELNARLLKLEHITADLTSSWHSSGIRVKPYAVLIRGGTSVAKSQITTVINHIISKANDLPQGEEFTCTINGNDKYQSNFRSHHICVVFDDMGNTRYERAEGNPLFVLIQFINNMHCAAMSPEAEKKGKNDIRCKIVLVTTNTIDLGAKYFSNNPASIMRRFDMVLDVELKESSLNHEGNISERFIDQPIPDMWHITASRVKVKRNGGLSDSFELVTLFKDGDICDLIPVIGERSKAHLTQQDKLVKAQTNMHLLPSCEHHPMCPMPCVLCAKAAVVTPNLSKKTGQGLFTFKNPLDHTSEFNSESPTLVEQYPIKGTQAPIYPEDPLGSKKPGYFALRGAEALDAMGRMRLCIEDKCGDINAMRARVLTDLMDKNPNYKMMLAVAGAVVAVGSIAVLLTKKKEGQGPAYSKLLLDAKHAVQFKDRDDYYKQFKNVVKVAYSHAEAAVSTPISKLNHKIDKNLAYCTGHVIDPLTREELTPEEYINLVPVGDGWWLAPGHFFPLGSHVKIQATFVPRDSVGAKVISEIIDRSNTVPIMGSDAVLVYLSHGGDNYDFSKFMLPTDTCKGTEKISLYHRSRNCTAPSASILSGKIHKRGLMKIQTIGTYNAAEYKLSSGKTHKGMCGSLVLIDAPNPSILGIHTAGVTDTVEGACALITQEDIRKAKDLHLQRTEVQRIRIAETTDLPTHVTGIDIGLSDDVHPKSPVNRVSVKEDEPRSFELFGQHGIGTSKFKSEVVRSCISEKVDSVMEIPLRHGAPNRKGAEQSLAADFDKMTKIRPPLIPEVLAKAVSDIKAKHEKFISARPDFQEGIHTIDLNAGINGADGVPGIDRINTTTSFGFPRNIPKFKLMVLKAMDRITSGNAVEYEFDSSVIDMQKLTGDMLEDFHGGRRVNVFMRFNGKDECVTFQKMESGKVRFFAGASAVLVIVARMLFLPTIAMMSYFPDVFESFVGINPTGKDWEWYVQYITKHGSDRMFNGDFKAFDKEMAASIASGSWEVLIHVCRLSGISEDTIKMMEGLATECIYPIYEIQGILAKVFGSNPSGHALTVIINGFANAIYLRYAYYMMHWRAAPPGTLFEDLVIPPFDEMVAVSTFGDDNCGSVNKEEKLFNHTSLQAELLEIGVHYTMADKESESRPFIDIDECDFIKRGLGIHPQLGVPIGNLNLDSIGKMLHMTKVVRGNQENTEAQIVGAVMSGAMAEFFYHSKEMYDERLPQMQFIAETTVDSAGNPLAPHFRPPSVQELIERYHKSICLYEPLPKNWSTQSGDYECEWVPDYYGQTEPSQRRDWDDESIDYTDYADITVCFEELHMVTCRASRRKRQFARVLADLNLLERILNEPHMHHFRPQMIYNPLNGHLEHCGIMNALSVYTMVRLCEIPWPHDLVRHLHGYLRADQFDETFRILQQLANDRPLTHEEKLAVGMPQNSRHYEYDIGWSHVHNVAFVMSRVTTPGGPVTEWFSYLPLMLPNYATRQRAIVARSDHHIRMRNYNNARREIIDTYGRQSEIGQRKLILLSNSRPIFSS